MDMNNMPVELQEELTRVLHRICIHIHDTSGLSIVCLEIRHGSDALSRNSTTSVSGAVMGVGIERAPFNRENTAKAVDSLLDDMMKRAKKKDKEGDSK